MFESLWQITLELAPWLLLGMAIAGLLHGLLPPDFVGRHLRGRAGVAKAVVLGVPLPLCSCGVIPTGLGLKKDGASNGASVGFLISTPQTGVDSILVSASFLGWPFALFKVAAAAITGLVGGWIADRAPSCPRRRRQRVLRVRPAEDRADHARWSTTRSTSCARSGTGSPSASSPRR